MSETQKQQRRNNNKEVPEYLVLDVAEVHRLDEEESMSFVARRRVASFFYGIDPTYSRTLVRGLPVMHAHTTSNTNKQTKQTKSYNSEHTRSARDGVVSCRPEP